jgi:hypothetical protein
MTHTPRRAQRNPRAVGNDLSFSTHRPPVATAESLGQAPWHVSCHVSSASPAAGAQGGGSDVIGQNTPHLALGRAAADGIYPFLIKELSWSRDLLRCYWWLLPWVSVCNMGWERSTGHRVLSKQTVRPRLPTCTVRQVSLRATYLAAPKRSKPRHSGQVGTMPIPIRFVVPMPRLDTALFAISHQRSRSRKGMWRDSHALPKPKLAIDGRKIRYAAWHATSSVRPGRCFE